MEAIAAIMSAEVTPVMFFSFMAVISTIGLIGVLWYYNRRDKKDRLEKWLN